MSFTRNTITLTLLVIFVVNLASRVAFGCSPAANAPNPCTWTQEEIDNCKDMVSKCGGMTSRSYFYRSENQVGGGEEARRGGGLQVTEAPKKMATTTPDQGMLN